jgi:hypothetical protein
MYIDTAFTLATVLTKGHTDFFEARSSGGYFNHVWGVHPIADIGGTSAHEIRVVEFSSTQTIIEGVAFGRQWPKFLAPFNLLASQRELIKLLVGIITQEKIDVIMTTDPIYSGLFGVILKRLTKAKLIVGVVANYDLAYETNGFIALPRLIPWFWLQNLISGFVLRSSDYIFGVNADNLEWGFRHGADRTRGGSIFLCAQYPVMPSARAG